VGCEAKLRSEASSCEAGGEPRRRTLVSESGYRTFFAPIDEIAAASSIDTYALWLQRYSPAGFPLMLLPGGGLNSTISFFTGNSPFNAIEEFKGQYRCITADLRNAPSGQSTGPVEVDRPWDSYADDQLGLMDHLGIDKFMVMGFCIGGPFIWSLLKRAPNRPALSTALRGSTPALARGVLPTLVHPFPGDSLTVSAPLCAFG
jgi:pimeloyl-ACP methyl ester carboxylesterase